MSQKKEVPEAQIPTVRKPQLHRKLCVLLAKVGAPEVIVTGDDGTRYVVSVARPS